MKFYLDADFTSEEKTVKGKKKLKIAGYANTIDKDRVGDIIEATAWVDGVKNYRKNPILLLQHDHGKPIGRVNNVRIDPKGLFIEATVSDAAEKQYGVHTLIKDQILKSFSVGFIPKSSTYNKKNDTFYVNEVDLLEVSVVSVPANQESLFSIRKSFDTDEKYEEFRKTCKEIDEEVTLSEVSEDIIIEEEEVEEVDPYKEIPVANLLKEDKFIEEIASIKELISKKIVVDEEPQKNDNIDNDTGEEKEKDMDHDTGAPLIINTGTQAEEEVKTPVAEVKAPQVEKLIEKTGEAVEKQIETEDTSLNDEIDSLKSQLNQYKEQIAALNQSKMVYQEQKRREQFSDKDLATAVILQHAFRKNEPTDTKFGARMKDVVSGNNPDRFKEAFSTNVYEEMEQQLVIAPMFDSIAINQRDFYMPISEEATEDYIAQFPSGTSYNTLSHGTDTTNRPRGRQHTISSLKFSPHKYMASTWIAKDETEDTVLPLIDFLRRATTRRMARAIDKTLLMGTGKLSGFATDIGNSSEANIAIKSTESGPGGHPSVMRGVMRLAADVDALTFQGAAADTLSVSDINRARVAIGKYGLQLGNHLCFITSVGGYNDLVTHTDFQTIDKFGPNATYLTGSVGAVYGIPIVISEFMANPGGGVADSAIGCLIYKPGFMVGMRRAMEIESEYEPSIQVTAMYMSTRFDFKALTSATDTVNTNGGALNSTTWAYASVVRNNS